MGSIEVLGSLYMKSGREIDLMKLKKVILLCGQICLSVYMFRNDMNFRSG